MNVTDRVCNLECIKAGGNVHEFVGPVKIVLVDPPQDLYNRRKSGAAVIAVANMMIGANTLFMLLFTLGFKLPKYINFHIILCTVGFQFCMPLAILMLHSLHGAAAPLKKSGRRIEHFSLHLIGMACSVTGSLLAILFGEQSVIDPPAKYSSAHFFSGCVALGLAGITLVCGPCLFILRGELIVPTCFTSTHRLLGVLSFVASSVCFVLGIIKPTMQLWLYIIGYMAPTYLIVFFTAFYTLVVITTPLKKIFAKSVKCNG